MKKSYLLLSASLLIAGAALLVPSQTSKPHNPAYVIYPLTQDGQGNTSIGAPTSDLPAQPVDTPSAPAPSDTPAPTPAPAPTAPATPTTPAQYLITQPVPTTTTFTLTPEGN
jgi:hypothetical protein